MCFSALVHIILVVIPSKYLFQSKFYTSFFVFIDMNNLTTAWMFTSHTRIYILWLFRIYATIAAFLVFGIFHVLITYRRVFNKRITSFLVIGLLLLEILVTVSNRSVSIRCIYLFITRIFCRSLGKRVCRRYNIALLFLQYPCGICGNCLKAVNFLTHTFGYTVFPLCFDNRFFDNNLL